MWHIQKVAFKEIKHMFYGPRGKLTCFAVVLNDSSGSARGSFPNTDKKLLTGSTVNTEDSETRKSPTNSLVL